MPSSDSAGLELEVTLRYFPALGRAQALRDVLLDAAELNPRLRFSDVQLPLGEWRDHKLDPAFAGDFQSLPTLTWCERSGGEAAPAPVTLSEALPIASFLARQLGFYDGLTPAQIARMEAIVSCCYVDVMIMVGMAIWCEMLFPGTKVEAGAERTVPRMLAKLARLEAQLPESGWLGGTRPNVADFFVLESFESMALLLGPQRSDALRTRLPRLGAFAALTRARPALQAAAAQRPAHFSGSADEQGMLERIWSAPLGGVI